MINKLKNLFPSLSTYEVYNPTSKDHHWYTTEDGEIFSISKNDITKKDIELLSIFLNPIEEDFPTQTEEEIMWFQRIFHPQTEEQEDIHSFRFVYFEIEGETIEPTIFKNALEEIFSKRVPILWNNKNEGIIIEVEGEELTDYSQIIDLLMSDLYINIKFYVGQTREDLTNIQKRYESVLTNGRLGVKLVKKAVFSYVDILPHLMIRSVDHKIKEELIETVLKDFKDDKETLKMIETFLYCNLNISLTAKQLYLHRNSLQYRIDKFIEQTNIDLREFHNALTVYFALLALADE